MAASRCSTTAADSARRRIRRSGPLSDGVFRCPVRPSMTRSRPRSLAAIDSRQYILGPECRAFEQEFARLQRRQARGADVERDGRALDGARGLRRQVERRGARPVAHRLSDHRGHLLRRRRADLRRRRRLLHRRPEGRRGQGDAADGGVRARCTSTGTPPIFPACSSSARRAASGSSRTAPRPHGAAWQGRKVGSFGRAGVFSFYPSKNLTVMGDGGLLVTDDDDVAARCRRLRDHGRVNKDVHTRGRLQPALQRHPGGDRARAPAPARRHERPPPCPGRSLCARARAGCPSRLPRESPGARHVYHLYVVRARAARRPRRAS